MHNRLGWFMAALGLVVVLPASHVAAQSPKKKGLAAAVAKVVDTSATVAAAGVVDQALGTEATSIAGAGTPCGVGMPGVATAGGAIVGVAKKQLKKESTAPAAVVPCGRAAVATPTGAGTVTAAQVQALYAQQGMKIELAQAEMIAAQLRMQQSAAGMPAMAGMTAMPGMGQAYGAAPNPGATAGQMAQTMMAATPVGLAAAALPMAGGLAKGLKGMFGGGPPNAEKMAKKLGEGRLELKQLSYEGDTDEPKGASQELFTAAVQALQHAEGVYGVTVPVEEGTDPALAQRRATRIWATLVSMGVPPERFTADGLVPSAEAKVVKKGDARPVILKAP